jgi:Zn-finger nucleic acid-binding protein
MRTCSNCGAPLAGAPDARVVCAFCHREDAPAPKEVPVPVPVQVVNTVVQVVGSPSEAPVELRCPHCRTRLVTVRASDVDLSGCGRCGGIWVDNASARRVLATPDRIFGELADRAGQNARGSTPRAERPTCPSCPAVLDKVSAHGIELDVCAEHGTWFDRFELSRLTATLRGEAVPGVRARPDALVRCAGCGATLRADQANLGDQGLACDACWRKRQAALAAAAERRIYGDSPEATTGAVIIGVAAAMLGAALSSRDS